MATQQHSGSLYVGDLHESITEAQLYELFRAIGHISVIRVCRDNQTRRSLGYAYVNFQNPSDAERALETLNYAIIKGKPIRIMWSQRDPSMRKSGIGNIFIKNLDKSIDNKALLDTFSAFGHILSCKVSVKQDRKAATVDDDKVTHRGYGFVHFETQESAELAIAKVNGMLLNGKPVYVGPFIKRNERVKHFNVDEKFTNVFVKNLDKSVEKEEFDRLFAEFGEIQHSDLGYDEHGKSKGFGFVNYQKHEDAVKAVTNMNDKEIKEKKLYVARHQRREERIAKVADLAEKRKFEANKKDQQTNLYIKNLDDTFDDAKLKEVFSPYGNITSAKVMMRDDKSNVSKGFGFANFENPEDAAKALNEMNGKIVGSKPLYVSYAQRKEARKLQLEAQFNHRGMAYQGFPPHMPPMGFPHQHPQFYPHPRQMQPYQKPRYSRIPPQQMAQPVPMAAANGQTYMSYAQAISRGGPMPPNMQVPRISAHPGQMPMAGRRPYGGPQPRTGNTRFKYNQNARNRPDQQGMPIEQVPQQVLPVTQHVVPNLQLNLQNLAEFPSEQQKQILGDRLYPLVFQHNPENAAQITGMFLEMEPGDVLHLIEDNTALTSRIQEAAAVLKTTPATATSVEAK